MRLTKHLPDFINDILEFQEVDKTLSPELDLIDDRLYEVQENQFIMSANDAGLSRYEKMFNITPVHDIDVRRFNILNKINSITPYTIRWLINNLTLLIGAENFELDLNTDLYTMSISLNIESVKFYKSLVAKIREQIPANIALELTDLILINKGVHITSFLDETSVEIINEKNILTLPVANIVIGGANTLHKQEVINID